MNTILAKEGGYLPQIAYDIPIEERVFVKRLSGVRATYEYYREASTEEIEEWEAYKRSSPANGPAVE